MTFSHYDFIDNDFFFFLARLAPPTQMPQRSLLPMFAGLQKSDGFHKKIHRSVTMLLPKRLLLVYETQ